MNTKAKNFWAKALCNLSKGKFLEQSLFPIKLRACHFDGALRQRNLNVVCSNDFTKVNADNYSNLTPK